MKNDAWRSCRPFPFTLVGALIALPITAPADTAAEFASHYQEAYARGRDLIPGPQTPLDTSSIATRPDLQSVGPKGALTGNASFVADGTVIQLAGPKAAFRPTEQNMRGLVAACAMISLAGMAAIVEAAKAGAGNAFPCHELGRNPGQPTVLFEEGFFMEDGWVRSISEVLISKGMAFAFRDGAGRPVFPGYARAEEAARSARIGIWVNAHFAHPSVERYRADPTIH